MDLKLVGCMALAGGCSFAAAYVATLSSAAHTSQSSARASPLNEAVERVRRLAVVRGMEERAEVARMRAECLRQMPVMLDVVTLGRGFAWLDTGTMESLFEASQFVRTVERAQDLPVSVPEEIAYENGWVSRDKLLECAERYGKSDYGAHLRAVAEGRIAPGSREARR